MKRTVPQTAGLAVIAVMLAIAIACSGGAPMASTPHTTNATATPTAPSTPTTPPTSPTPPTSQAAKAPVTVNIGDAPAERVVSFEVTVTSVSLTAADGSSVNVFTGNRRVEVTHLAGTLEPLALGSIPQGTYTQVEVTVADPAVSFLDDNGSVKNFEAAGFTRTLNIALNPPLTIGSTAAILLNLDLNAAASVTIDPTTGAVTINPIFNVTGQPADDQKNQPEAGELERIAGMVTAVDTTKSTFTISLGQSGVSLTFTTNASTKFEIGDSTNGGLAALAAGMVVRVDGMTQADGTLLATDVEAALPVTTASELEGVVTSVTGTPVTSFTIVAQDGNSDGGSSDGGEQNLVGGAVTVSVDANSKFAVGAGGLTVDATAFPFDAAHLTQGQRVEADSLSQPEAVGNAATTMLTAQKVTLQQQALQGSVSNLVGTLTAGQFTLTVAPDSAFALLTGKTTVTVFSQASTDMRDDVFNDDNGGDGGGDGGGTSNIGQVQVRGLLFFDGTAYKMLAVRVSSLQD